MVRVALFARGKHVGSRHILARRTLFKAVVSQIVLHVGLALHQVLQLAFRQLRSCMRPVQRLRLLSRAHVQKTLVQLANFVCGQVHIFVASQDVVKRFLLQRLNFRLAFVYLSGNGSYLWDQSFGRLRGRAGTRTSHRVLSTTFLLAA